MVVGTQQPPPPSVMRGAGGEPAYRLVMFAGWLWCTYWGPSGQPGGRWSLPERFRSGSAVAGPCHTCTQYAGRAWPIIFASCQSTLGLCPC
jgi:hypothetical protein